MLSFAALCAYAGYTLALAVLTGPLWSGAASRKNRSSRSGKGVGGIPRPLAVCCALAVFAFIPPGALPPFYDISVGAAASLVCLGLTLAAAGLVPGTDGRALRMAALYALLPLCLALGSCMWYAHQRGAPGSVFSMGTLSVMPIWEGAKLWSKAGLLLLLLGLARGGTEARRLAGAAGLAGRLWALAFSAVLVCLFAPWSLGRLLGLSGVWLLVADFCFFWLKTLLAALWVMPAVGHAGKKIPPWPFLGAGAACLAFV